MPTGSASDQGVISGFRGPASLGRDMSGQYACNGRGPGIASRSSVDMSRKSSLCTSGSMITVKQLASPPFFVSTATFPFMAVPRPPSSQQVF